MNIAITVPVRDKATYVSLIGPFLNYYAKVPHAENSVEAAWICNNSKLKSLWCSTYTLEQVEKMIQEYGGQIIALYSDGLDFDMFELQQLRRQVGDSDVIQAQF